MMARKPLELPPTLPRLRQGHASLPRRAQRHLSLRPSRPGSRVIDHATASKMCAEITARRAWMRVTQPRIRRTTFSILESLIQDSVAGVSEEEN
jgi:hypothetical protein